MRARLAFTMFELLMVLAVLSVLVGVALPSIQSWLHRAKIDHAGTTLVQLASEARRRAIEDGEVWTIRYASNESRLLLTQVNETLSGAAGKRHSPIDERKLNQEMRMEFLDAKSKSQLNDIRVSPLGAISPVEVRIFYRNMLVGSYVSDRLTGEIREKRESTHSVSRFQR